MNEHYELPRGDGPEFYPAEIVAQTNKRSLALAIRRELGEGYVITPGLCMLYAVRRLVATDAGRAALPHAAPLPSGPKLVQYWLERLPLGERRILSVLIETWPRAIARSDLDSRTGYRRSARDPYLQRLAAKNLIEEPERGKVRASGDLFG